jgi:hypothetical protein
VGGFAPPRPPFFSFKFISFTKRNEKRLIPNSVWGKQLCTQLYRIQFILKWGLRPHTPVLNLFSHSFYAKNSFHTFNSFQHMWKWDTIHNSTQLLHAFTFNTA